ncbi:hypothetical protein CW304_19650 [Bacillus sp. UFRGS-B20]|nr:hypothetical protein CW304_19650 [Bacillus sp. UFRGS-B20]
MSFPALYLVITRSIRIFYHTKHDWQNTFQKVFISALLFIIKSYVLVGVNTIVLESLKISIQLRSHLFKVTT